MSREKNLAKNTLILAIGTFLPKLASFITLPILTGCLIKEEYGVYELIIDLVSLLLPTVTLQIQTAAFRFLIDRRDKTEEIKSIVTNIYVFILPVSIAALLIFFVCMQLFMSEQSLLIRCLICLYFFADIIVNATRQIARGINKNLDYSISAIVSAGCKMIFAVVFVWYYKIGLTGAVIALMLSSVFSLIVLMITSKIYRYISIRAISKQQIKDLGAYSWPMVPNCMSMWVMRVSDRFVITGFMGYAAVAVYSAANKIPSLLTLAQNTFTMAWQENASIVSKDKDADAYYSSMFRFIYDLMAGSMGLLISMTPLLFKILIHGDYGDSYPHIPILFLAMFFYSMCAFLGGIYVAYMDTKSVGITTMIAAACNLLINLCLIRSIGIYAASISTLVSYILLYYYRLFDVKKLVKMQYQHGHLMIVFGIMLIERILCFFQNPILNCVNAALGIIVFFVLNKSFVKVVLTKGGALINKRSLFKK